ncbi:hypothetical protein TNCV_3662101 [Trichonephila clavipes]|nr:hypothetical protein TNCV_3662101 [Trichonephila clavipes]
MMSVFGVIRNPWGTNPRDKVAKISRIGHLVRLHGSQNIIIDLGFSSRSITFLKAQRSPGMKFAKPSLTSTNIYNIYSKYRT